MKRVLVFLALLSIWLAAPGCGTKNKLFAPEGEPGSLPDATFAGPTVAQHAPEKIKMNDFCVYVTGIGWSCTNDIWDENGCYTVVDEDAYFAAPRFARVGDAFPTVGDPTDTDPGIGDLKSGPNPADGDGSVVKSLYGPALVGDPTADDAPRR